VIFQIEPGWQSVLADDLQKDYIASLADFLDQEYAGSIPIYPPKSKIFEALRKTSYDDVKVVILGQDPYHGENQAHGLCFSVLPGMPFPPSLKNIFKELHQDLGEPYPNDGCLDKWAEQGVLLLNTVLTVRQGQAFSHQGFGWERFTDAIVEKLAQKKDPPIFVLWGKAAQDKCRRLKAIQHLPSELFLMSVHPSPLSVYRGFFGSRPFSKINAFLISQGKSPIEWGLCQK